MSFIALTYNCRTRPVKLLTRLVKSHKRKKQLISNYDDQRRSSLHSFYRMHKNKTLNQSETLPLLQYLSRSVIVHVIAKKLFGLLFLNTQSQAVSFIPRSNQRNIDMLNLSKYHSPNMDYHLVGQALQPGSSGSTWNHFMQTVLLILQTSWETGITHDDSISWQKALKIEVTYWNNIQGISDY